MRLENYMNKNIQQMFSKYWSREFRKPLEYYTHLAVPLVIRFLRQIKSYKTFHI